MRLDSEGSVAEFAKTVGTDVAKFLGEAPGMSAFAFENGVAYHTYPRTRAASTRSGGCINGSIERRKGRNETGVRWRRHHEYD